MSLNLSEAREKLRNGKRDLESTQGPLSRAMAPMLVDKIPIRRNGSLLDDFAVLKLQTPDEALTDKAFE